MAKTIFTGTLSNPASPSSRIFWCAGRGSGPQMWHSTGVGLSFVYNEKNQWMRKWWMRRFWCLSLPNSIKSEMPRTRAQVLAVFKAAEGFQYATQVENIVFKFYIQCWRISILYLLTCGMWAFLEGSRKLWSNVLYIEVWEFRIGLIFTINSIQLESADFTNSINSYQFTDIKKL